jgi:hypothetical protein
MKGGTTMEIRRRSLFKIAAGGAIFIAGISHLTKDSSCTWNLWHQLRHRLAMNSLPTKNPDIIAKKTNQSIVLFSRAHKTDLLKLNPTAGSIWEMCDGSHCVSDIIHHIGNRYDVARGQCSDDVLITVAKLYQRGLILI